MEHLLLYRLKVCFHNFLGLLFCFRVLFLFFNYNYGISDMPLGKKLTIVEQSQIDVLNTLGWSQVKIAKQLKRSRKIVQTHLNSKTTPKKKETRGRKNKLTERAERAVTKKLSKKRASLEDVRKELSDAGVEVCRKTVHNVVHRSPIVAYELMEKTPKLKTEHQVARIEFAKRNQKTIWKQVGYSRVTNNFCCLGDLE